MMRLPYVIDSNLHRSPIAVIPGETTTAQAVRPVRPFLTPDIGS
jgi:hypothetical protein